MAISHEHVSDIVKNLPHVASVAKRIENDPIFLKNTDREFMNRFLFHAGQVVERMNHLDPNPAEGRTGAIITVARPGEDCFLSIHEVGKAQGKAKLESPFELDRDKPSKYVTNVLAKVAKLIQHPDLKASSLDTADSKSAPLFVETAPVTGEPRKVVGGAIRWKIDGKDTIFGCGGYNSVDDEAVILATLVRMGEMSGSDSLTLAREIGNERFSKLKLFR